MQLKNTYLLFPFFIIQELVLFSYKQFVFFKKMNYFFLFGRLNFIIGFSLQVLILPLQVQPLHSWTLQVHSGLSPAILDARNATYFTIEIFKLEELQIFFIPVVWGFYYFFISLFFRSWADLFRIALGSLFLRLKNNSIFLK